MNYGAGSAGSQFFPVLEVRRDGYRVYLSDERRRNEKNWPRPFGVAVKIRPYFILALDGGPATVRRGEARLRLAGFSLATLPTP